MIYLLIALWLVMVVLVFLNERKSRRVQDPYWRHYLNGPDKRIENY